MGNPANLVAGYFQFGQTKADFYDDFEYVFDKTVSQFCYGSNFSPLCSWLKRSLGIESEGSAKWHWSCHSHCEIRKVLNLPLLFI